MVTKFCINHFATNYQSSQRDFTTLIPKVWVSVQHAAPVEVIIWRQSSSAKFFETTGRHLQRFCLFLLFVFLMTTTTTTTTTTAATTTVAVVKLNTALYTVVENNFACVALPVDVAVVVSLTTSHLRPILLHLLQVFLNLIKALKRTCTSKFIRSP